MNRAVNIEYWDSECKCYSMMAEVRQLKNKYEKKKHQLKTIADINLTSKYIEISNYQLKLMLKSKFKLIRKYESILKSTLNLK